MSEYTDKIMKIFLNDKKEDNCEICIIADIKSTMKKKRLRHGTGGLTMAKYILKQEAIFALTNEVKTHNNPVKRAYTRAVAIIEQITAEDVQPVVHCKDCKHRKEHHYEEIGEKPYIKYECKFTKYSMSDDGFCSFGARMNLKDGEQNDT